jgi:hypothetical protein
MISIPNAGLSALAALCLAVQAPCQTQTETPWMNLFNGKDLNRLSYVKENWRADSGMIVGKAKSSYNNFCHTTRKFSDFSLSIRARLWETSTAYINSGIQYRSAFIDSGKHSLKGYQMDIGDGYNGSMYPEGGYPAGAKNVSPSPACRAEAVAKANQWCHYLITADGQKIRHEMNGILCAEYTGTQADGYIGMQLHFTDIVMEVNFKDVFIRPLNNSFAIPDSLSTYLNADYTSKTASRISLAGGASRSYPLRLQGNTLTVSPLFRGADGTVHVSLSDPSGRTRFSRSIVADGELPLAVGLPDFGAGNLLLRVGRGPKAYAGVVRAAN